MRIGKRARVTEKPAKVEVPEVLPREKIYPRDCFVCGQPMEKMNGEPVVQCIACDVLEDATTVGRFHTREQMTSTWMGHVITFIDHGKYHVPSP